MTDFRGIKVAPGDKIAYAVRHGSHMWLKEATVLFLTFKGRDVLDNEIVHLTCRPIERRQNVVLSRPTFVVIEKKKTPISEEE